MLAVRRIRMGLGGRIASPLGGLGERLDRRINWAKRLCDEAVFELNPNTGDTVRLRGEPGELDGGGRSMRGIAGSERPRMVRGEMSDIELGEFTLLLSVSGDAGADVDLVSNLRRCPFDCEGICTFESLSDGLCNGLVTPRVSSWAGQEVSLVMPRSWKT